MSGGTEYGTNNSLSSGSLVIVDRDGLHNLRTRPSLINYCRSIWAKRDFVVAHAMAKSLRAGQDTYLGRAWIVLTPILQVVIYVVVFGVVLQVSRGMDNYIGFIMIGVIFFGMLSRGLTQGNGLIQSSRKLIGAVSFPRACLVFSVGLKQLIDDIVPALVAVVGAIALQPSHAPSLSVIAIVPLYVLLHIFTLGLTFFTARATAFIPDLKQVISTLQRGLFFFSGVFYDVDRFAQIPVLRELMLANPFYQFLHAFRTVTLEGKFVEWTTVTFLVLVSALTLVFGLIYFWRAEERYANAV